MRSYPELPVHPTIARALAGRGYETATPVQAAVLDPALAGRDLLVSSPTGSGKTVAFGTLIADTLLAETGAPRGTAPRALVVAPTRELAAQVCRELEWLFAEAKVRLGAFTGGTSVGGDLRKLRVGTDLVVGTPGRLVDLHERKWLDLSAVQALVLDEADEMLDLGFKDDLEYLLGHAPPERRTLLFSATLPREIVKMAATFQRDAIRVDPRPEGAAAGHADIKYVAHLVRAHDRLAAVVNVLLAASDSKTIVFCRTREGVGELHQRLVDYGFKAAAISGDRAQGERDRALEALRTGRARVLVATNVAARGLDLPDVDLVVHADLPENADSLTHRSGRTGRAGKKGTSMVIADVTERRKAERLISVATRAPVRWTPAPAAEDVRRAMEDRLAAELLAQAQAAKPEEGAVGAAAEFPQDELMSLTDRLSATLPERVLVSLLLSRELARLPPAMKVSPVELQRFDRNARPPARGRDDGRGPGESVLFRVNLGADAKAEPGWLLPLICRRGGVTRREVGAIRVGPRWSTFEIAAEAAEDFAMSASRTDPRAPHVTIDRDDLPAAKAPVARPSAGRDDRAPRPQPIARLEPERSPRPHAHREPERSPRPHAHREPERSPRPHAAGHREPPRPHVPRREDDRAAREDRAPRSHQAVRSAGPTHARPHASKRNDAAAGQRPQWAPKRFGGGHAPPKRLDGAQSKTRKPEGRPTPAFKPIKGRPRPK